MEARYQVARQNQPVLFINRNRLAGLLIVRDDPTRYPVCDLRADLKQEKNRMYRYNVLTHRPSTVCQRFCSKSDYGQRCYQETCCENSTYQWVRDRQYYTIVFPLTVVLKPC